MPCYPYFLAGSVRGLATMLWGSTFPSSGHWALVADHATVERCGSTVGCRASRARSRACSRRRAGAAPWPASLACGPREQAVGPRRAGRAPREPGRNGHCRPGHRADFGPVAREFKKIHFLFFIRFQTEFKLQKIVSKYPELQKLLNQFRWIHNFLIYPIKLFRKIETFSLCQFLLKLK
jgi:hypothetical protein